MWRGRRELLPTACPWGLTSLVIEETSMDREGAFVRDAYAGVADGRRSHRPDNRISRRANIRSRVRSIFCFSHARIRFRDPAPSVDATVLFRYARAIRRRSSAVSVLVYLLVAGTVFLFVNVCVVRRYDTRTMDMSTDALIAMLPPILPLVDMGDFANAWSASCSFSGHSGSFSGSRECILRSRFCA